MQQPYVRCRQFRHRDSRLSRDFCAIARERDEQQQVGKGFSDDFYGLEDCEFKGLVFLAELCEKYRRYGIERQDAPGVSYACPIAFISEGRCNGGGKSCHQGEECGTDAEDRDECA